MFTGQDVWCWQTIAGYSTCLSVRVIVVQTLQYSWMYHLSMCMTRNIEAAWAALTWRHTAAAWLNEMANQMGPPMYRPSSTRSFLPLLCQCPWWRPTLRRRSPWRVRWAPSGRRAASWTRARCSACRGSGLSSSTSAGRSSSRCRRSSRTAALKTAAKNVYHFVLCVCTIHKTCGEIDVKLKRF